MNDEFFFEVNNLQTKEKHGSYLTLNWISLLKGRERLKTKIRELLTVRF